MKKLLYVFVALIAVIAIAITAVVLLVDTEDVKQLLVKQVREATGRELVIEGDLSWRFFPSIGFELGKTQLMDHPDFSTQPTLGFDLASMSVAVMPLLDRQIELGDIELSGLSIRYEVNQSGTSNIDDLLQGDESSTQDPSSESTSEGGASAEPWAISLAGLNIKEATANLIDHQAGTQQLIGPINLSLEGLSLGTANRFSLDSAYDDGAITLTQSAEGMLTIASDLATITIDELSNQLVAEGEALPNGKLSVSNSGNIHIDQTAQQFSWKQFVTQIDEQITISGELGVGYAGVPTISYQLSIPELDVNPYLASEEQDENGEPDSAPKSEQDKQQEPDLTALSQFNLDGKLSIGKLLFQKLEVTDIEQHTSLQSGLLKLNQTSAKLYQGAINLSGQLDSNKSPAPFKLTSTINGVQALPLLQAAADLEIVAGTLNADTNLSGVGLSESALRSKIAGPLKATFTDGAIYGINIPHKIRQAKTSLTGADASQLAEEKTDFSELILDVMLGKGVAKLNAASMQSPLLRVDGDGSTHLVKETLDLRFLVKVVSSLEGQGGNNDLSGVTFPIDIAGTWTQPKIDLDFKALLEAQFGSEVKEKVGQEVDRVIKDEGLRDQVKDVLGNFFN